MGLNQIERRAADEDDFCAPGTSSLSQGPGDLTGIVTVDKENFLRQSGNLQRIDTCAPGVDKAALMVDEIGVENDCRVIKPGPLLSRFSKAHNRRRALNVGDCAVPEFTIEALNLTGLTQSPKTRLYGNKDIRLGNGKELAMGTEILGVCLSGGDQAERDDDGDRGYGPKNRPPPEGAIRRMLRVRGSSW